MDEARRIRVLTADDEEILRRNVCRTIRAIPDFELIGDVASGREVVDFVRTQTPDVVLMDVEMETSDDGLVAARAIYELNPEIAIIMLTVHDEDDTVYDSYSIGSVKDYVTKSYNNSEIISAIRRVYADQNKLDSANQKLRCEFQRLRRNESSLLLATHILSQMTPSEKEVIRLKLSGMSTRQIAQKRFVEEGTIKTQVNSMLRKLGFEKSSQIVDLIRELRLEKLFTK